MIFQVLKTSLLSLGVGFIVELSTIWLNTPFLHEFLSTNLVTLLVALLAINGATMGIVLTKIRDLIDTNKGGASFFDNTRQQMLLSIKEQIALIIIAITLLSFKSSPEVLKVENLSLLINVCCIGVFVYAITILYDTTNSVLVIIDFKS